MEHSLYRVSAGFIELISLTIGKFYRIRRSQRETLAGKNLRSPLSRAVNIRFYVNDCDVVVS
mgnify:CR=1 FL=1